jgi:GNAT superfamily N-acetyltransferase
MIRQGKDTDRETLMQMWKLCFPLDTEHFIRFYFDKVYANDETLVYAENDCPVASLQIIPYRIKTGDNFSQGGYISGAMTHPDYRKKGYMDKLMRASFDEMIKKEYDYAFLIPQEKGLIDMYAKYGFRLCDPNPSPPENIVIKTTAQLGQIQQVFLNEKGIWLENEPFFPDERKGMIKRLNPAVKEITTLYMGMMLD